MKYFIIASYPRSGSTWLRFILCNLFQPVEGGHTFESVNRVIPYLGDGLIESDNNRLPFLKTHETVAHASLHLVRHPGDVLISQYWYHRKLYGENRELPEWLESMEYGKNWRDMVNYYAGCYFEKYEELLTHPTKVVGNIVSNLQPDNVLIPLQYEKAIAASSVANMRAVENMPNPEIPFVRSATQKQWTLLPDELQSKILEANKKELKLYNY